MSGLQCNILQEEIFYRNLNSAKWLLAITENFNSKLMLKNQNISVCFFPWDWLSLAGMLCWILYFFSTYKVRRCPYPLKISCSCVSMNTDGKIKSFTIDASYWSCTCNYCIEIKINQHINSKLVFDLKPSVLPALLYTLLCCVPLLIKHSKTDMGVVARAHISV